MYLYLLYLSTIKANKKLIYYYKYPYDIIILYLFRIQLWHMYDIVSNGYLYMFIVCRHTTHMQTHLLYIDVYCVSLLGYTCILSLNHIFVYDILNLIDIFIGYVQTKYKKINEQLILCANRQINTHFVIAISFTQLIWGNDCRY